MKHLYFFLFTLCILSLSCTSENPNIETVIEGNTDDTDPPVINTSSFKQISNLKVYEDLLIELQLEDKGSGIESVELLIDQTEVLKTNDVTTISYLLKPDELTVGKHTLTLKAYDKSQNKAEENFDFEVIRKFVSIDFPDNFTRKGVDEIYVLLSDAEGNLLSQFRHNDVAETIDITLEQNITEGEEFMLTFVEVFDKSLYDFKVYANLNTANLGKKITLTKRSLPFVTKSFDYMVPFYKPNYTLRASGDDYSAVCIQNIFSGYTSETLPNGEEGAEQLFIQYHNSRSVDSYKYGYFESFHEKGKLSEEDLKTDVTNGRYRILNSRANPGLVLYAFEDDDHLNRLSGHMVYTNYSTPRLIDDDTFFYSFPTDLFSHYVYDIKLSNFNITGYGKPDVIKVPQETMNYSLGSSTTINFFGLENYEVGRMRISVTGNNPSSMNFVFDGTSSQIVVPKLPNDIIPTHIADAFNSGDFRLEQGVAEDNEDFMTYKDYLKNVFITSKPFFLTSPVRKRIFKSSISTQLLPINEFPYNFSL